MSEETSEALYTVVLTKLKDDEARKKVAETMSRIATNLPADKAFKRMETLPWTLSRRATANNAARLVRVMGRLGAEVQVSPPLPEVISGGPTGNETEILPSATAAPELQQMASGEASKAPLASTTPLSAPSQATEEQHVPPSPSPPSSPPPPPPTPALQTMDSSGSSGGEGFSIEPLSLGGILDRTFQICRRHFWKLFAIVGIPYLVLAVLAIGVSIVVAVVGFTLQALGTVPTWLLVTGALTVIPSIIVAIIAVFYLSQGALIHAVSVVHLGREVNISDTYRFVLARLGKFVFTSLLFVIVIFATFLMAVLFGVVLFFICKETTSSGWWSSIAWLPLILIPIYASIKLMLFDKVVIIEDIAYINSLKRSWELLTGHAAGGWPRGYFLRLIILLCLFGLVSMTIAMVFTLPAAAFVGLMPESRIVGPVAHWLLSNIGSLIGGMFGAVCLVVFYYDIRNRKEGFDLKMLAGIAEGSRKSD